MARQQQQSGGIQTEDVIRLGLISPQNNRNLDTSNTVSNKTSIVGMGVVNKFIVGATTNKLKDKHFINCYAEKIQGSSGSTSSYYLTKRAGWGTLIGTSQKDIGTALHVWAGNADSVVYALGATNSTVYDVVGAYGSLTGYATFISETIISGTPYIVIPTNGSRGYYSTGGAFTEITDTDWPGTGGVGLTLTGPFVFVDGFMFAMTTNGRIYNSDLNSLSAWTAASYIEANTYPDTGIGLAKYMNMLVAFGKETVEFFYNAGNTPGSPLSKYESGFVHFGCISQYGFTQIEDTVAWVSGSDKSGLSVYMLDGIQPKKISTAFIDSVLGQATTTSFYVASMKLAGKTLVVITSSMGTYVYSVEDDMWHEWSSTTPVWHHISGTTQGARSVYGLSRTDTRGNVYSIIPGSYVYNDGGYTYPMIVQTAKFDGETIENKFLNKLSVVGDKSSSTNTLSICYTDDDYQTISNPRTVDLNSTEPYLMNNGKFKRRAWRLSNTSSIATRLEALELQLKKGIH